MFIITYYFKANKYIYNRISLTHVNYKLCKNLRRIKQQMRLTNGQFMKTICFDPKDLSYVIEMWFTYTRINVE